MRTMRIAIVFLTVAAVATMAHATSDFVVAKLVGAPQWGDSTPGGVANIGGTWSAANVCTGVYRLQVDSTAGTHGGLGDQLVSELALAGNGMRLDAFCCDIRQYAPTSYVTYDIVQPQNSGIWNGLSFTTDQINKKIADLAKLYDAHFTTSWSNLDAAAFQSCVWEIVNEKPSNGYSISNGNGVFYENGYQGGSWETQANGWLTGLAAQSPSNLKLYVLANDTYQDYAFYVDGFGSAPSVPEPLTMLGVLAGIVGVGGYIRKSVRSRQPV